MPNKNTTIANAKQVIKKVNHVAALNFTENIDREKRIFDELTKYANVFQIENELLVLGQKGQEFFIANKYATSQD